MLQCSLLSLGVLGDVSTLQPPGICGVAVSGSSCSLGRAPRARGRFWDRGAMWQLMPPAERRQANPPQRLSPCLAGLGGQLFLPASLSGTRFILWLLSLHRVMGAYPPPTASPPRREWAWLSLAWKRHRFETISPPADFSMERSGEDITIYSAQCVYTAWHPPAFQASILPIQRGGSPSDVLSGPRPLPWELPWWQGDRHFWKSPTSPIDFFYFCLP